MLFKAVFLLGLFGVASSTLPHIRECDPVEKRQMPSLCSNYENIVHLYESKQKDDAKQMELQRRVDAVEAQLNATKANLEAELRNLQRVNEVKSVAFSASITESPTSFTGPRTASSKKTLIFNHVFTNIGNAYNSKTGMFVAPVKGVYLFTFMTSGSSSHTSGAILLKNGRYQVSTKEVKGPDPSDTTSNTVILNLNAIDCVSIILWEGGKIQRGVFSGFLIFPAM